MSCVRRAMLGVTMFGVAVATKLADNTSPPELQNIGLKKRLRSFAKSAGLPPPEPVNCGLKKRQRPSRATSGTGMGTSPQTGAKKLKTDGVPEGATREEKMDDAGILGNLLDLRGWRNVDMGAGGNCLFLSIAPQVSAEEVAAACERSGLPQSDVHEWDSLPLLERARVLRRLSIADEEAFIAAVAEARSSGAVLTEYQRWRVVEYFKDMAEEFVSSGITELAEGVPRENIHAVYQRVRELARDTPEERMVDFVLKHAEEYMRITGQDGNWAGSSEMAALSSSLGRPFQAFGNDRVSRETVELGDVGGGRWGVLPYFEATPPSGAGGEPVRIFQLNGGGDYQMLG